MGFKSSCRTKDISRKRTRIYWGFKVSLFSRNKLKDLLSKCNSIRDDIIGVIKSGSNGTNWVVRFELLEITPDYCRKVHREIQSIFPEIKEKV